MPSEASTTPGTWVTITATLKITPATTGWQNQRTTRYSRPSPMSVRNSHSGVASSARGGRKYDSIMCWNMCAEYRYCSPRSWIGHQLATNSNVIAPAKQPMLRRVTGA